MPSPNTEPVLSDPAAAGAVSPPPPTGKLPPLVGAPTPLPPIKGASAPSHPALSPTGVASPPPPPPAAATEKPWWATRPEPSEGACKVAVFSTRNYDVAGLEGGLRAKFGDELYNAGRCPYFFRYLEPALNAETAILAKECIAICIFVNDKCNEEVSHEGTEIRSSIVSQKDSSHSRGRFFLLFPGA